ncbi:MAG: helix-turn-helix transcriptional regulator [Phaeodactylibacter sp.]|nr:helix-turn-helix transcriptional regulator [Phaeodactylibacter sp.]MCB9299852.1 helix-turn-helix transcriptional regulator [Lewinellaceae bacterium]
MGKMIIWPGPKYSECSKAHETDSLVYADDVIRYLKFESPLSIKFCLRDALRYVVNGKKIIVPPGGFFIANDGTEMECLPNKPGVQALFVFFANDLIQDVHRNHSLSDTALLNDPGTGTTAEPARFFEHVYRHPTAISERLASLARQMSVSGTAVPELPPRIFFGLAEQLLAEQQDISQRIGRINARTTATRQELFRRVLIGKEYMLDQWDAKLGLPQIARHACLSPYHFHRTFREVYGPPPMKWFRKLKFEKAKELLRGGAMTVTEVALQCGFSDVFTFSKAFKREWGMNPSEV